ncbi:MAG: peptidylprolyl isomerase [Prevotellaceae bacterium]|jgi:peptidyl-prolyl cis-trans isomerase SurA|nr:peptidylprolyl isomerase [Prevotellaceae bacterium]
MMNILQKTALSVLLITAFAVTSQAQETKGKNIIDKVVAVIGNEAVLLSDIETEIHQRRIYGMLSEENLFCKVLEDMLQSKLLVAQAKIDSLTASQSAIQSSVDNRMNEYISRLGSEKAVEEQLQKPVSKIREMLQEYAKDYILIEQMKNKIVTGIEITPADVKRFYETIPQDSMPVVPEQYSFQQISIYPPTAEANFEVRERLLELRERIMKGEKFNTLAILYSQDTESSKRGGELGLAPAANYVMAFRNAALSLKPGQVSHVVETEYGFHIIQMIEKQGKDLINVRHILLKPVYSANEQRVAFSRLDSIKNLITSDSITFEQAALFFSRDEKTRMNGGLVANPQTLSPRFDKDQLGTNYFVLRELKLGQISDPFKSTDDNGREVYKIVKLKEILPSHKANLKDDFPVIKNMVEGQKQMEKLTEWLVRKQEETYIKIDDDYKTCKFESNNWIK